MVSVGREVPVRPTPWARTHHVQLHPTQASATSQSISHRSPRESGERIPFPAGPPAHQVPPCRATACPQHQATGPGGFIKLPPKPLPPLHEHPSPAHILLPRPVPGHPAHLGAGTDHLPPLLCCHPQLNPHLLPAPWFWEQLGWLRSRTLCHPRSLMTTQPRSRSWRAGSCPAPAAGAGFKPCSGRGSAAGKGSQPKPFPPGIPSSILGFIRWTDRHRDCRLLPLAISPCRGPEPRQHFHIPFLQPSTRQPPSRSITGSCYSPPRAL